MQYTSLENILIYCSRPGETNVLKVLNILPLAKDRSKHLWITARINISLQVGAQTAKNFILAKIPTPHE
jgi:hypothetical protein